jgi:hypothetical protein
MREGGERGEGGREEEREKGREVRKGGVRREKGMRSEGGGGRRNTLRRVLEISKAGSEGSTLT